MNPQQIAALRAIARALIEICCDTEPLGSPAGILYAAMMTHGCTFVQFEQIMAGLVQAGFLRQQGDCYFATTSGKMFVNLELAKES